MTQINCQLERESEREPATDPTTGWWGSRLKGPHTLKKTWGAFTT